MEQLIQFAKLQAAGNDFVIINGQLLDDGQPTREQIQHLCHRNYGIGADGLITISDLQMHFFNADGSVGAMCGNGLRAAVLYGYVNGNLGRDQYFEIQADDGLHTVRYQNNDAITVEILYQAQPSKHLHPKLPHGLHFKGFFNTGVPHVVLEAADLEHVDVALLGRQLRFDPVFGPEGTNVNFARPAANGAIHLRTYERGVETETLACGTGSVATALAYGLYQGKRRIHTRGGILTIEQHGDKIYLTGSARMVYVGQILLDGHRP